MKTLLLIFLLGLLRLGAFSQTDIAGSSDHPMITRYPGSTIQWYDVNNFHPYEIAMGPEVGYRTVKDWLKVEGKVTRIYYVLKGERTMTEVFRNYVNALKRGGFEILVEGCFQERNVQKEIGGSSWMVVQYDRNPFPSSVDIRLLQGSSTTGGTSFVAAKLKTSQGVAYAAIGGHQYTKDEVVFMVDIIEVAQLEDGLVTVDAAAMARSIEKEGKVALYGIHFDFDKSAILPESEPTLAEIAKLMAQKPTLKLFVVGHTDNKGDLSYNLNLSEERARAVVTALTQKYGVEGSRLVAKGVGQLCPVASNTTDEGRALNRRVELVVQ